MVIKEFSDFNIEFEYRLWRYELFHYWLIDHEIVFEEQGEDIREFK